MYFQCFLLLFITIGFDGELGVVDDLCLVLHSFLHFVRLDYVGFILLDLLREDAFFFDLLVTKLHLKTCDSAFMRHMVLNN